MTARWVLIPVLLTMAGCGTVKSKDYTDLAIRTAQLQAQVDAARTSITLDGERERARREALEQFFQEWQMREGRRSHRPGST